MKKVLIIFLIANFSSPIVYSQTGWFFQNSGQSYWFLNSICFINSNTGFAAGNNGTLSKTTNAGLNWILQNTGTNNDFKSICFPSQNVGYIVGGGGVLVKTTDGSLSWNLYPAGTTSIQNSIFYLNEITGFVTSVNGNVLRTTNGGMNWTTTNVGSSPSLLSVYFLDNNTGFVTGYISGSPNTGVLYKTTNSGTNWLTVSFPFFSMGFSLFFTNTFNGYCVGIMQTGGFVLNTSDCGNNWSMKYQSAYGLCSTYFLDVNTGYAVGVSGAVYKTINGGNNWTAQQDLATSNTLTGVYFINYNTGWACGYSGTIIKTTSGGEIMGVTSYQEIPNKFSLYQNYPNPFNPSTKIKFSIPEVRGLMSEVRLVVYDVLGKEVETLVNEKLQQESYEVEWDASNYPSGVYFYRLSALDPETSSGFAFSETKRMVLVK